MRLPPTTNVSRNFSSVCWDADDSGSPVPGCAGLDTRRKANRLGLPDCDTEIRLSADQLVSACPTVSASEGGLQRSIKPQTQRQDDGKEAWPWLIAGITLSHEN